MKKILFNLSIAILFICLLYGCNIVPKSVQYQREEEKLLGSTDIVNPVVEEIQSVLNNLGYDTGNGDGRLGQKTREAIKEYQESIGLKATGYIDKLTLRQIEDTRRADEERELKNSYTASLAGEKDREKDVSQRLGISTRDIQTALKNAGFDPGAVDGKMGRRTRQAIKEFQKTKGLTVDGKVGMKTWSLLSKHL